MTAAAGTGTTRKTGSKRPRSSIAIKRAYDEPEPQDGLRVLVDRLWPRGLSKVKLKLDAWTRDVAPSTSLRKWYDHRPERFAEFRRRYGAELARSAEQLDLLRGLIKGHAATLLTATHDLALSHAEVLRGILLRKTK